MPNYQFQITACIVLYKNDITMLKQAIDSFLCTKLNVKIFLVDNSPTNELSQLADKDEIEYQHNPSNPGFGAAHNLIIKYVLGRSQYHIVLNPDVYFDPGNLEKLYEFMENHQEVGHVMPKVLYPDSSIQYLCKRNPTPFDLFARRFLPKIVQPVFRSRMERYEFKDRDYSKTMFDIPYLSGCFMFLRTSTLKTVGYFDERIFMYIEDADLTRRILKTARTAYYPNAVVYHHFAKGSHKNWRLTWYSIHGAYIYFNKWGWFNNSK